MHRFIGYFSASLTGTILVTAVLVGALPAFAGGFAVDFPRLTYPDTSIVSTDQTCLPPTSTAQTCPNK